jgi:hypothetical protein
MSPAETEFRAAVEKKKAAGMAHDKAVSAVNREFPHLVQQMRGTPASRPGAHRQASPVVHRSIIPHSTIEAFTQAVNTLMAERAAAGRPILKPEAAMLVNRKHKFF